MSSSYSYVICDIVILPSHPNNFMTQYERYLYLD
jgi:hypothetical protein